MHTFTNWRPIDLLTILLSNTKHIPIFMQTYYDYKKKHLKEQSQQLTMIPFVCTQINMYEQLTHRMSTH